MRVVRWALAVLGVALVTISAPAWGQVGTAFPADFPVIVDSSLGVPVIGFPPVPAQDREGNPHDFSESARLVGARELNLTGQGAFDDVLGSAHLGILNSPVTRERAFDFLSGDKRRR